MIDQERKQLTSSQLSTHAGAHDVTHDEFGMGNVESDSENLFAVINDRLSGRWKYAIPLALVLMFLGAIAGYVSSGIYYESRALIHVAPKKTPLMHETIETGMIPNYSAYVNSQVALLTSSRVIDRATNSLNIDELPFENRAEMRKAMERGIHARTERRSELISVSLRADTPDAAALMLHAMVEAYIELYASTDGQEFNRRMSQLRRLRESLSAQIRQKRGEIEELISDGEFVVSDFSRLIEERAIQIQVLETELRRFEGTLARFERTREDGNIEYSEPLPLEVLKDLSDEELLRLYNIDKRELESVDSELARLGHNLRAARSEYERISDRYHSSHPRYRNAERAAENLERRYREQLHGVAFEYLKAHTSDDGYNAREQVDFLEKEIARLRRQAREMGSMQLSLTQLRNELKDYEDDYANVNARIRELEIESDNIRTGNISVASPADRPSSPSTDRRRALAAIGAAGGFGAGFGLIFLLGSVDRRTYAVRQIESEGSSNRLLGVLPSLPKRKCDIESAQIAAHCVHQVRNQIEALRQRHESAVITISSPYQGDGKTSLTMALGASYAAAGYRTVMVDCDLTGRALSNNLMLGQSTGVQEAILSGELNGQVQQLPMENLHILPLGAVPTFGSERVRRVDLERLFDQLRKQYEIILVDTGPLYGSIEGLPVASASDAVLLTMRRGRRKFGIEQCIRAIRTLGIPYLGMVLNHAMSRDCYRYMSASHDSVNSNVEWDAESSTAVRSNVGANALHDAVVVTSRSPGSRDED